MQDSTAELLDTACLKLDRLELENARLRKRILELEWHVVNMRWSKPRNKRRTMEEMQSCGN